MTNCPICNDYTTQLRRASAKGDGEQFEAVKTLYVEHLQDQHGEIQPQTSHQITREDVREIYGRFGE